MKKVFALATTLILTAGFLIITATAALASCHAVSFSKPNYDIKENEGKVTITINRTIFGVGCTGTMEYNTSDGTAKTPSDYTATSCTNCKVLTGTQASYTFDVPIVDDTVVEGSKIFNVHFKHTPDDGQSVASGSASVTIQDNDAAPSPPPPSPPPSPKKSDSPTPSPSASASPSPSPTESEEPEESPSPSPEASASPSPIIQTQGKSDGGSKVAIIAVIAALVAAGSGFGIWKLRRT